MSEVDGHDLAHALLSTLGGRTMATREYGTTIATEHSVPGLSAPVVVGGPRDPDRAEPYWIGAHVGRYRITDELFDSVAAEAYSGTPLVTVPDAVRDGTIRLWTAKEFRPTALSVDSLMAAARSTARYADAVAYGLKAHEPASAGPAGADLGREVLEKLLRRDLMSGGHASSTFSSPSFRGQQMPDDPKHPPVIRNEGRGRWFVGASAWPVEPAKDLDEAATQLESEFPPDCVRLQINGDRLLAYGALGLVSFAIEDQFSLEAGILRVLDGDARSRGTVLDRVSDLITGYAKLDRTMAPEHRVTGKHGWLRPFTVKLSSKTKWANVSVLRPGTRELVPDGHISYQWIHALLDESNTDWERHGLRLMEQRLNWLRRFWSGSGQSVV